MFAHTSVALVPPLMISSFTAVVYTLSFFFFNDTATTEIYTLSLHDALPIYLGGKRIGVVTGAAMGPLMPQVLAEVAAVTGAQLDRKSTRLNSSHLVISYAVFCLKKKKKKKLERSACRSVRCRYA